MTTCGYICPSCEGRLFMENGDACTWCQPILKAPTKIISKEEWIQSVHFGACCSDPFEREDQPNSKSQS